ncbi:MAG: hypothetical protein ACK4RK_19080 [Gemmataceae bacterium]
MFEFPEVDGGNLCPASFLVLILAALGARLVEGYPVLRQLGIWSACVIFIALCGWGIAERKPMTAEELWPVVVTALLISGIALGFCWILLLIIGQLLTWTVGAAFRGLVAFTRSLAKRSREANARRRQRREEEERRQQQERNRQRCEAEAKAWAEGEEQRRQEKIKNVQDRYAAKVRMLETEKAAGRIDDNEFRCGCLDAKQKYLRDLEEAMP